MEGVAHALLALLAGGEQFGLELKGAFEARTAYTWPLNIGQVYTTLQRLVRDGYVAEVVDPKVSRHRRYRLTDEGQARLDRWFATGHTDHGRPRDERTIKIALAMASPRHDALAVLRGERDATSAALARLGQRHAKGEATVAVILNDAERCRLEGVIAWLDRCEALLNPS